MNYTHDTKRAVLYDAIRRDEEALKFLPRKRSWTPVQKAMAAAEYKKRIAVFEQVIEDIHRLESLEK
jgi:hypothetical protein